MSGKRSVGLLSCVLLIVAVCSTNAGAQELERGRVRDGVFEITLKTPDSKRIVIDELVRDPDLNPRAIFRVTSSGYMSFDEAEWVDKIEYKVFDAPVTEKPEYKQLARTLTQINSKLWAIKGVLRSYNRVSLRLMNICDKSMFPTLKAMDENIAQQLSVYKELTILRDLVVNSLDRFVKERTCVDKFAEYSKGLTHHSDRLTNLCQNYERLRKNAIDSSRGVYIGLDAPEPAETLPGVGDE
jgi:hypothetical protein